MSDSDDYGPAKRPRVGDFVSDLRDAVRDMQGEQSRTGERLASLEIKIDSLVSSQAETRRSIEVAAVREEAAQAQTRAELDKLRKEVEERPTRQEHKEAVRRIESLEGDRSKLAWGIVSAVIAAVAALIASIAKIAGGGQ